jgi:hypothetical protein
MVLYSPMPMEKSMVGDLLVDLIAVRVKKGSILVLVVMSQP